MREKERETVEMVVSSEPSWRVGGRTSKVARPVGAGFDWPSCLRNIKVDVTDS